jgi:hypothetical protein
MDPLGLCIARKIGSGIKKAIVEGAKGTWSAIKQASKLPSIIANRLNPYFGGQLDYKDAKVVGIFGNIGSIITGAFGVEMVINSESGELSFFKYKGVEAGLTSTGVGVKAGFIENLKSNREYLDYFLSVNFSAGKAWRGFGGSVFASEKEFLSPIVIDGPYGAALTWSTSNLQVTASASSTKYEPLGKTYKYWGYILDPVGTIMNYIDAD